jgi:leader peptidase (prepilin peptidase)/N-methyltransferase
VKTETHVPAAPFSPRDDQDAGVLRSSLGLTVIGVVVAVVLVGLTFLVIHPLGNAALFAVVQVVLVAIAVIDLRTRRIPNELVAALTVLSLAARSFAERGHLAESIVAGLAVFGFCLLLASVARGGFGMGDVKLAAALGFVLGKSVLLALVVGTTAGAVAGLIVIARRGSAGRRTTIAYGPYLALGGAVAILAFGVPPLA